MYYEIRTSNKESTVWQLLMRITIVDKSMEWLEWSKVNSVYALAEKQNKEQTKFSTSTSFTFRF